MEMLEPAPIPQGVKDQMRDVLGLMSPYSLRVFLDEIDKGNVDGTWYGGMYDSITTVKRQNFNACLLGWAGYLENMPVVDLVQDFAWAAPHLLGDTGVEAFVRNISECDSPEDNAYSAALYLFVAQYLEERERDV
jgi:hypothetical protein